MEFRQLGYSGLKVSVLSFGCGTFGGKGDFFSAWGNTDVQEATRLVDICLEAGLNFFDTADVKNYFAQPQFMNMTKNIADIIPLSFFMASSSLSTQDQAIVKGRTALFAVTRRSLRGF